MLIILGTAIFNSKTSISLNRTRHIGVCPPDTALQTPEHILQKCLLCIQLKEKQILAACYSCCYSEMRWGEKMSTLSLKLISFYEMRSF